LDKYKPTYLGKVLPSDPPKTKDFLQNNYPQFSDTYDAVKDESEDIRDVSGSFTSDSFSLKISANKSTLTNISNKIDTMISDEADNELSIIGDIITAKKKKKKK